MNPTVKEIIFRAILPQVFVATIYVCVHWVFVSVWLYFNYNDADHTKLLLVTLLGSILPIISYGAWALRKIIINSYAIIHERIIKDWLKDFSDSMAVKIVQGGEEVIKPKAQSKIIVSFKKWIEDKIKDYPTFIKSITLFVLKRIDYYEQFENISRMIVNRNVDHISDVINNRISNSLITTSQKVIPFMVIYLIPINIVLMILLWVY